MHSKELSGAGRAITKFNEYLALLTSEEKIGWTAYFRHEYLVYRGTYRGMTFEVAPRQVVGLPAVSAAFPDRRFDTCVLIWREESGQNLPLAVPVAPMSPSLLTVIHQQLPPGSIEPLAGDNLSSLRQVTGAMREDLPEDLGSLTEEIAQNK